MITYTLPYSVDLGGMEYEIRTDFRAVLDIIEALGDPDLSEEEKMWIILDIFYFSPTWEEIPDEYVQEALDKCKWFIDCGEASKENKRPKLISWEQDFPYIASPINRIIGQDIRGIKYDAATNKGGLHWWTFMSSYYEIGDCTFAQIVRIRKTKAAGKKLSKEDSQWYRENRHLVDFKTKYTDKEDELLRKWGMK